MIYIEERINNKVPGQTSLFLKFNYNKELINLIQGFSVRSWDKDSKEWEIPVTNLSQFLDTACLFDDISISLLQDNCQVAENKSDINLNLEKFKTKPFPYQQDGIKYGLQHQKWLLLDSPGLGKTLQMIYLAQELKERDNIEHCFIICGLNTLKMNWKKEIEKHSNLSCRIIGERYNKKGKYYIGGVKERLEDLKSKIDEFFIITNVETLRNNDIIKELTKKKPVNKIDMMVADEVHVFKSPSSEQGKNFLKLKAKYMVGLTGTLIINNPCDCYVPLKWIGVEKCNFSTFKYYYCTFTGPFNNILLGYKNMKVIQAQLEGNSLRRTKALLDLPEKTIIDEYLDMDSVQEQFYKNIVDGVVTQIDKVVMNTTNLLSATIRLRQALDCPSVLTTEIIPSAKIERAAQLIDEIISNGDKVVVFSSFKETLNQLQVKLPLEYNALLCTGDIDDETISQNIDKFQNTEESKVILATISKMGTGITLTSASYAIFIGSAWTAAQNLQCEDRIHRVGSKKPVFIYHLWTNNSIDTRIKEIVEDKNLISGYVVDNQCPPKLAAKLKTIIQDLEK